MDSLIQDCIDYLRDVAKKTPSILATKEDAVYFKPAPFKKAAVKASLPPPSPPLPLPAAKKVVSKEEAIVFTPPEAVKPQPVLPKKNYNDMRLVVEKLFPEMNLRDAPLDDSHARKMSKLYEETYLDAAVVVIAFGEVGAGFEFLKHVTQAIDKLIAPAQLVQGSTHEEWDILLNSPTLKAILCSPWNAWQSTSLARHFRQNGATGEQFLGKHKLFLLEPSSSYLKTAEKKRKLWHLISTQLLS